VEIKRVPISEVEIWEKNPRNIKTKDFERLKRQIQELGVYKPLICIRENGKYVTLGGNMRLRALVALNLKEVDVSLVQAKDEATKIKYALSDNDRVGQYDEQALAELTYPHIEEINLEDYRIDVGEPISLKDVIEDYAPDIDGEDEIPDIDDSPAITKMGDLFTLGKHRLLCGDATKEGDVKRLMNGDKVDMVFTDPPYGINLDVSFAGMPLIWEKKTLKHKFKDKVIGDNEPFDASCLMSMADEIFLFGADYYADTLPNNGVNGTWYVWDKREDEIFDKMWGSPFELIWGSQKRRKNFIRMRWASFFSRAESEQSTNRIHPTQKPIALCKWFIKKFSKENQIIWDGYIGSGTTLIACEKLNRICYGMEIEPKYCDVIITRYSNFTDIPEEEIRATKENG